MEKPVYGFLVSLFNVFIVYVVFANFLGWSGGAINVTGYDGVDWTNSYVGFESLRIAVNDFQHSLGSFNLKGFIDAIQSLTNAITAGIPKYLASLQKGFNILELGMLLLTLLLQPALVIGYTLYCLIYVLAWVFAFLITFFKFCGGAYNITFEDTSDIWSQWSYLSSEWDWSNIPSSVLIPRAL